jgi:hypothetical protein
LAVPCFEIPLELNQPRLILARGDSNAARGRHRCAHQPGDRSVCARYLGNGAQCQGAARRCQGIQSAFSSAGIKMDVSVDPSLDSGTCIIVVGAKPTP